VNDESLNRDRLTRVVTDSARSPSTNAHDVLITQGWGRAAYNVFRSLRRHGLSVVVGTDRFSGMAALSRYASARFRHPSITAQPASFITSVKEALQRYSPKVYLPTGEDTYVVAKHAGELQEAGVIIPIAPFATLKLLHKKNQVISLARSLGIPTPETLDPKDDDDVRNFCRHFGSPVVLKRISSSGARGVFYVTDDEMDRRHGVAATIAGMNLSDFVVQQYVKGAGFGVSMLFNQGQLRAKFTHKRLNERPVTGGISTLRIGVTHPQLEEYAQTLLERVKFHGVAMVEFKVDEQTGQSWLLEVNPRFWGSLALAIQSGVDFPYLLYRMATEGDVPPVLEYQTGVVVKWLLGDIGAALGQLKNRGGSSLRRQVRPHVHGYDDLYWDDPVPFFGSAVMTLRKFLETRNWPPHELELNIDDLDHT
jgi:predicted ATP-grasp superfamily ATP-dependent carboligase